MEEEISIPKKIFQTWKTQTLPEAWQASPRSIAEHFPDFEYILSDDIQNEEYVRNYYPQYLDVYLHLPYNIQRADMIRYMKLHREGGLYIDADTKVKKRFAHLFTSKNDIFLVRSSNLSSCFTNSIMASKPGVPFWIDLLNEIGKPLPSWVVGKHLTVMYSTGPALVDKMVQKYSGTVGFLPAKYLLPCSVCDVVCDTSSSFIEPLQGQSWNGWDSKILNVLLCHWWILCLALGFFLLLWLLI